MSPPAFAPRSAELAAIANPFASGIVGSALDDIRSIDVPSINRAAFERCLVLIEHVRATNAGSSLLVLGAAGTGKTHLLARLRDYFDRIASTGQGCLVIPIPMHTGPPMIWRHLRHHVADALLRKMPDGTRLFQCKLALTPEALDQVSNRDLGIVLGLLARGIHVSDSAAWLHGAELPEEVMDTLGLGRPRYEDELLEDTAFQVVRDVCRLMEPEPVVFCLDQVEALRSYPGDTASLVAAGKMVVALHEELRNAAVISCLQTSRLPEVEEVIRGAHADRMLRNRVRLQPLNWQQAQQFITVRLDSNPKLRELRAGNTGIWPLDAARLKTLFDPGGECVPRHLIFRCREAFEQVAERPRTPPEPVELVLARRFEDLRVPKDPAASEGILRAGLPLLMRSRGAGFETPKDQPDSIIDGRITGTSPTLVAICNQGNATSLAARLKKIADAWNPVPGMRLVLLRDERLGVSTTARTTYKRLKTLQERGAQFVTVSAEAIASLDALRALLANAESGDLWYRSESIEASAVERWITGHMPGELEELSESLMRGGDPQTSADAGLVPALTAYVAEHRVAAIAEAAGALQAKPEEVVDCARRHPLRFGLLGGSPMVIFQATDEAAAA